LACWQFQESLVRRTTWIGLSVAVDPARKAYARELSEAMDKTGDFDRAARELEHEATLDPHDAYLHLRLAQEYMRLGRRADFEREFETYSKLSTIAISPRGAAQSPDQHSRSPRRKRLRVVIDFRDWQTIVAAGMKAVGAGMRSEAGTTRTFIFGMLAVAALAFSITLTSGNLSQAMAQSDDAAGDVATAPPAADQTDQNAASDAAAQAHDAADQAAAALDTATDERNQLESDGASQDQIDAANAAIAQARANKEAADEAAQSADEAVGQ
jgi:hypothetical protein